MYLLSRLVVAYSIFAAQQQYLILMPCYFIFGVIAGVGGRKGGGSPDKPAET